MILRSLCMPTTIWALRFILWISLLGLTWRNTCTFLLSFRKGFCTVPPPIRSLSCWEFRRMASFILGDIARLVEMLNLKPTKLSKRRWFRATILTELLFSLTCSRGISFHDCRGVHLSSGAPWNWRMVRKTSIKLNNVCSFLQVDIKIRIYYLPLLPSLHKVHL